LGAHGSIVTGTTCSGSSGNGFYIAARSCTVRNCTATGVAVGVNITETTALVEDTDVSGATADGVLIQTVGGRLGDDAIIRRVTAGAAGIRNAGQDRARVEQCDVTGGAIEIETGANNCTVVGDLSMTVTNSGTATVTYDGTDAELTAELVGAGFTPIAATLGADTAQQIMAVARFAHRAGTGTMYYEITPASSLSTVAAPMAAAYNALR